MRRKSRFRLRPLHVVVLCIAVLGTVVALQPSAEGQPGAIQRTAARVEQSPLDEPIGWLVDAKRNYAAVKDYSCMLISRERVRGELLDENIIQMKVKTQPFSIYMRWLGPKKTAGQEVAFVMGKNNNKMRVKSNMIGKNLIGFIPIDPNDPRVLQHSRHNILEAGIGNMIEATLKQWSSERELDKTRIKTNEAAYNQRECVRVELARTERNQAFYCFRTVIYLEKMSKLPIRIENYDWPRQGGSAEGELLEMFSYANLQFNTGLRDEEFNK